MGSNKISTIDLEEPVVEALNTIDTVAEQIMTVDANVDSIKGTVESNATGIASNGTKLDTINTNVSDNKTTLATVNTNCANLNSRLTSARAGYLDYLANSTYGLNAIKTAINNVNTAVGNSGSKYKFYQEDLQCSNTTTKNSEITLKTYNTGSVSYIPYDVYISFPGSGNNSYVDTVQVNLYIDNILIDSLSIQNQKTGAKTGLFSVAGVYGSVMKITYKYTSGYSGSGIVGDAATVTIRYAGP